MDAFFARNRLSAYIDGALSPEEAAAVAEAIARDPLLQAEHAEMMGGVALVRKHGAKHAPDDLHDKIMAQVAREGRPGGAVARLRGLLRRAPVEAVALMAAAAAVVVMIQRPPGPEAPADEAPPVAAVVAPPAAATPAELPPTPTPAPAVGSPRPRQIAAAASPVSKAEEPPESSAEPRTFNGSTGYKLSVSDPETMRTLSALAQSAGGTMYDLKNRPATPTPLTVEDNYQRVVLMVPVAEAAAVDDWLRRAGGRGIQPETSMVFGEGQMGFYVEVAYLE